MKPKSILFAVILFFFLISLACTAPTPYPTAKPSPTLNPLVELLHATRVTNPTTSSGMKTFNCEDIPVPEGYTHQDCYWIDESWNTWGVLYYTDEGIKGIASFVNRDAPSSVVKKSANWSADAAHWALWDSEDAIQCADALSYMQDGDTVRCGSLSVSAFISEDRNYYVIYYIQQ